MTDLQLTIPAQHQDGRGIRLKSREVHEWLQNLPYMDTARTLQLANQQLRLLNRQVIAPSPRLEILEDFLRTYQRLGGTSPGDDAISDSIQPLLKKLCQNIGFGYKILVHTLAAGKGGGGLLHTRHLSRAMLGAVHTLGLQLLYHYSHHQRVPRAVWSECLAIYQHAQSLGRDDYSASLADGPPFSIADYFCLYALIKLADPYHLRPGMLRALHRYFLAHIGLTAMVAPGAPAADATLLKLSSSGQRVQPDETAGIAIDISALLKQMHNDILRLKQNNSAAINGLAADTSATTLLAALQQTQLHWSAPRQRKAAREALVTGVELVAGLEAAWCVLNRNRPFDPSRYLSGSEEHVLDSAVRGLTATTAGRPVTPLQCSTADRTNGGIGIRHHGISPVLCVGQLVGVRRATGGGNAWVLGVLRWLVEPESQSGFDAGLQYLAGEAQPVVIRPLDSSGFGGDYQPAMTATQKRGSARVQTLIALSRQLQTGDAFSLVDERGVQRRARCIELLEAGAGFDRFIFQLTE